MLPPNVEIPPKIKIVLQVLNDINDFSRLNLRPERIDQVACFSDAIINLRCCNPKIPAAEGIDPAKDNVCAIHWACKTYYGARLGVGLPAGDPYDFSKSLAYCKTLTYEGLLAALYAREEFLIANPPGTLLAQSQQEDSQEDTMTTHAQTNATHAPVATPHVAAAPAPVAAVAPPPAPVAPKPVKAPKPKPQAVAAPVVAAVPAPAPHVAAAPAPVVEEETVEIDDSNVGEDGTVEAAGDDSDSGEAETTADGVPVKRPPVSPIWGYKPGSMGYLILHFMKDLTPKDESLLWQRCTTKGFTDTAKFKGLLAQMLTLGAITQNGSTYTRIPHQSEIDAKNAKLAAREARKSAKAEEKKTKAPGEKKAPKPKVTADGVPVKRDPVKPIHGYKPGSMAFLILSFMRDGTPKTTEQIWARCEHKGFTDRAKMLGLLIDMQSKSAIKTEGDAHTRLPQPVAA